MRPSSEGAWHRRGFALYALFARTLAAPGCVSVRLEASLACCGCAAFCAVVFSDSRLRSFFFSFLPPSFFCRFFSDMISSLAPLVKVMPNTVENCSE